MILDQVSFSNLKATGDGGVLYSDPAATYSLNLLISGVKAIGVKANNLGSFMAFPGTINPYLNLTVINSSLACNLANISQGNNYAQSMQDLGAS